jgi:hypothetical protein
VNGATKVKIEIISRKFNIEENKSVGLATVQGLSPALNPKSALLAKDQEFIQ